MKGVSSIAVEILFIFTNASRIIAARTSASAVVLAHLVACVVMICKAGVTTIGAASHETLAIGAVAIVATVVKTGVAIVVATAVEPRHLFWCKGRQIRIRKIATLSHEPRKVGFNYG